MIEQWILEKLEQVKDVSPIIIRDPQRTIISGAQVVEAWLGDVREGRTAV